MKPLRHRDPTPNRRFGDDGSERRKSLAPLCQNSESDSLPRLGRSLCDGVRIHQVVRHDVDWAKHSAAPHHLHSSVATNRAAAKLSRSHAPHWGLLSRCLAVPTGRSTQRRRVSKKGRSERRSTRPGRPPRPTSSSTSRCSTIEPHGHLGGVSPEALEAASNYRLEVSTGPVCRLLRRSAQTGRSAQ